MNIIILILIVILDFIGFTLIFPVIPDLLLFYLNHSHSHLDGFFINFFNKIDDFLFNYFNILEKNENIVLIIGSILSSIFALLQFFSAPIWGRISDYIGRKKTLILTSLGLSLSYLLWIFSKSFSFFLLSRILGGLMAGNISVAFAAIVDISTEEKRISYMGLMGMAIGFGFILGPIIGGLLSIIDLTNFQPQIFHPFSFCALGSFILTLISFHLNLFYFQETLTSKKNLSAKELKIFTLISVILNPFYYLIKASLKIKYVSFLNLIFMLIFTGYEFIFTFFYKFQFQLKPYQLGLVFFYLGFWIAFWQGFLPRILSKKLNETQLLRLGLMLLPVTFILQPLFLNHITLSLLSLIPLTVGNALIQPSINSYASKHSTENEKGKIMGVVRSTGSFARAFGPLIGGILYWLLGIQITLWIFSIFIFAVILITFYL